jgi:hypothetical protein
MLYHFDLQYDSLHGKQLLPDHAVPCETVLSRDAFPGTSCQATIGVSLRDALAAISQQHLAKPLAGPQLT